MPTFRSTRKRKKCFFVMCLRLSDHKVLHNIASSSRFFRFHSDFHAFFARISYLNFFEFKELNKTIIPFALLGYETGGVFIDNCSAYTQLFQLFLPCGDYIVSLNTIPFLRMHYSEPLI